MLIKAHDSKFAMYPGSTKGVLLVAGNEKGSCGICSDLWNLSASECWTSKTCRKIATPSDSRMEVGGYLDGLCIKVAERNEG